MAHFLCNRYFYPDRLCGNRLLSITSRAGAQRRYRVTDPGAIVIGETVPRRDQRHERIQERPSKCGVEHRPAERHFIRERNKRDAIGWNAKLRDDQSAECSVACCHRRRGNGADLSATLTYGTPSTASTIFKTTAPRPFPSERNRRSASRIARPQVSLADRILILSLTIKTTRPGPCKAYSFKMQYPPAYHSDERYTNTNRRRQRYVEPGNAPRMRRGRSS